MIKELLRATVSEMIMDFYALVYGIRRSSCLYRIVVESQGNAAGDSHFKFNKVLNWTGSTVKYFTFEHSM